jgi:tRNA-2-methylthio-N6-dimethylallyladenosine synthase
VSRASSEIIEEVRGLVEKGYKSITLLGQNVNSYGRDKTGSELNFAGLLQAIGELIERMRADVWVYFTSPHPRDMSREVIEVMARYKCLAKQVHLPLQSGDDKVLIRMNRKHSMTRYREIVGWIRELLPSATLFTDIIVGFTGETDEQFENTRQAMLEFSYNMAFIAMYSPRPGAASFRWNDDIGMEVKKLRHALLTKDLAQVAGAYNQSLVGNTLKVLVKGPDRKEGFLSGHTEGKTVVRFESSDLDLVGHFVELKILSATPFSAEGVRVDTHVKV